MKQKKTGWRDRDKAESLFLLSKFVAKSMVQNKRGKIINTGSMYSFFGSGIIPTYSVARGAVIQLTKSMAIELAPYNIQVNVIAQGWFKTDMTALVKTIPLLPDEMNAASRSLGTNRRTCRYRCLPGV